jgi:hypothetical protein
VDLFLCHTGANKDWVRDLAVRLESEVINNRPLRVFFDEWDIAPGENILTRIEEELSRARFVAVALSPALTRAAWPTLEWQSQVYDDPTGKRGRIIPLVVEKFDPNTLEPLEIPLPFRLLRHIDFAERKQFQARYQLLLARIRGQTPRNARSPGVDPISVFGLSAGPEAASLVDEVLLGNVFHAHPPTLLYSDATSTATHSEIRSSLDGNFRTPFVLHAGRLYSFVPPDHPGNPFRRFLSRSAPKAERTQDILKDQERYRHVVWLCNDALREHCHALRLRAVPGKRNLYYPIVKSGEQRAFSWGRGAPLTLAKVTEGNRRLGVHHAAAMRFICLDAELHLLIEPRYFFTTDGYNPVEGAKAGRYSVQWGSKEGNRTVLRRLLMWPRILAAGSTAVSLRTGGTEVLEVSVTPTHGRSNQGILGDDKDVQSLLEGGEAGEIFETDDLEALAAEHHELLAGQEQEEEYSDTASNHSDDDEAESGDASLDVEGQS